MVRRAILYVRADLAREMDSAGRSVEEAAVSAAGGKPSSVGMWPRGATSRGCSSSSSRSSG